MDLKEIADGLTVKFNIPDLAVEVGEVALEIDGMPILLAEGNGDAIIITGFVGDAPAEGGEQFANLLLNATTELMDSKSLALARNPETGALTLVQRVAQIGLAIDGFCEELSSFVNALETWRGLLEDFRPAVEAAQAFAAEQPDEQNLVQSGFLQV